MRAVRYLFDVLLKQGYPTMARPSFPGPPPPQQMGGGGYNTGAYGAPAPQSRPAGQGGQQAGTPTTRSVPLEKVC